MVISLRENEQSSIFIIKATANSSLATINPSCEFANAESSIFSIEYFPRSFFVSLLLLNLHDEHDLFLVQAHRLVQCTKAKIS